MVKSKFNSGIIEIFREMPTHKDKNSSIKRKVLKQQLKKLKNESINRRRRRSRQKIYEAPVPIPEKIEKT